MTQILTYANIMSTKAKEIQMNTKKGSADMNKDAWYQYFTERKAVADQNAELVEEKFKECEAYTEKVLKKKYPE